MPAFVCSTCGVQSIESDKPPETCKICEDERQYVGLLGQAWTTLEELRTDHRNYFVEEEPGLRSFSTEPKFGIGQRAFVLQAAHGNVLWDCVSLLDEQTRKTIVGGLTAIAISHPHYYATCVDWSRTFGNVPVYIHEADRRWVMRPDPAIRFWSGETHDLGGGLTLIRCGGHFEGGTVLHWAHGPGTLLTGDVIQVVQDRRWVSFMYSYPNLIPLSASAITRIVEAVQPFPFDRVYGAFPLMTVREDGKGAIARSAGRYLRAIRD